MFRSAATKTASLSSIISPFRSLRLSPSASFSTSSSRSSSLIQRQSFLPQRRSLPILQQTPPPCSFPFSTTATNQGAKKKVLSAKQIGKQRQEATFKKKQKAGKTKAAAGGRRDSRIGMIRYHLLHPILPRPLKFGRQRNLRHWTIMRAWRLYQHQLRDSQSQELERQYNSIRAAMECLRTVDPDGKGGDGGRLYRIAGEGIGLDRRIEWPIEMRILTDTPPTKGFDEEWKRD